MKEFKDLKFKPHQMDSEGIHAVELFPNGYGISVCRFKLQGIPEFGTSSRYGSYTSNENEFEAAVLIGEPDNWSICYNTPITDDVLGHLSEDDVTELMKKIQEL